MARGVLNRRVGSCRLLLLVFRIYTFGRSGQSSVEFIGVVLSWWPNLVPLDCQGDLRAGYGYPSGRMLPFQQDIAPTWRGQGFNKRSLVEVAVELFHGGIWLFQANRKNGCEENRRKERKETMRGMHGSATLSEGDAMEY